MQEYRTFGVEIMCAVGYTWFIINFNTIYFPGFSGKKF
jgi:hypothetical protein